MPPFSILPIEVRKSVEQQVRRVLEQAVERLSADHAFIAYLDAPFYAKAPPIFAVQAGLWIKGDEARALFLDISQGMCGLCAQRDEVVIWDSDEGSRESYFPVIVDVTSEIVAPLHYRERCAGVMLLDRRSHRRRGKFDDEDRQLLKRYALEIEWALDPSREIRRRLKELTTQCLLQTGSLRGYIAVKKPDGSLDQVSDGKDHETIFLTLSSTEGLCGEVFQSGIPLNAGKVLEYPAYVPSDANVKSECIYPVKQESETVAIVNMESDEDYFYNLERVRVIEWCAERARKIITTYSPLRESDYFEPLMSLLNQSARVASLEDPGASTEDVRGRLIERACGLARKIARTPECVFWDWELSHPRPEILPRKIARQELEEGGFYPDSSGILVIHKPLRLDGRIIGILAVRITASDEFARISLDWLKMEFADQLSRLLAVLAICYRRWLFQIQHHTFLGTLRKLTVHGRSWAHIEEMVQRVPRMLDCTHCALFYARTEKPKFYVGPHTAPQMFIFGDVPYYSPAQVTGLIPAVLRSGETLCVGNVNNRGEVQARGLTFEGRLREMERKEDCRSMLIVPIQWEGEVLGVFRAHRSNNSRRSGFGGQEIQMLETLANLVAPVLARERRRSPSPAG